MGAFFILYNLSMFISRFARTITSFPHFKCREMALFHIVCYFKLFSLLVGAFRIITTRKKFPILRTRNL